MRSLVLEGLAERLAENVIRAAQHTPFRGTGGYAAPSARPFPQAEAELARVADFFTFFRDPPDLAGQRVLDFGCGYGGRTVGYATRYGARDVIGVEPFAHMIDKCRAFAADVPTVRFVVNTEQTIPLPDASVDVVVSYDVFEHVSDPVAMLAELRRVLVPGGRFYLVFIPYYGALSHHLGYVTRLPGLHWIFRPETLVGAVNRILSNGGRERFGTNPQPDPPMAFGGHRRCLPSVNGLTGEEVRALCGDWRIADWHATPLAEQYRLPGRALARLAGRVSPAVEEALAFNCVAVLHRPT